MKSKHWKQMIAIIGGFVILLVAIACLFLFDDAYQMKEDGFQVIAGEKKNYEKGTAFVYKKNGVSCRGASDNEYLASTPIYFDENKKKILLVEEGIYIQGSQAIMRRTESFSEVSIKQGLTYNDVKLDGGFLFDGRNSYTFLEEMTLKINGKDIKVSPLSSIVVNSRDVFCLYDVSKKQIMMDHIYTESLTASHKDYHIDLINDILYTQNNEKVLLYSKPELLEELK